MTLQQSEKIYAFFDFDGTLISRDSFLLLLFMGFKRKNCWRAALLILFMPVFMATGLLRLDKTCAKSLLLWTITFGRSKKKNIAFLRQAAQSIGKTYWFAEASSTLSALTEQKTRVVVVSASGTFWVKTILKQQAAPHVCVLGSRLGFFCGGVILASKNCYGVEKIKRIQNALGKDVIWHSAWTDHIADLPLLQQAEKRYLICPLKRHLKTFSRALKDNYVILRWHRSTSRLAAKE